MSSNAPVGPDRRTSGPAGDGISIRNDSVTVDADRDAHRGAPTGAGTTTAPAAHPGSRTPRRREVVHRERERHGGVKIGAAFFGWLTATGTAVLLTALFAAAGTAVGYSAGTDVAQAVSAAESDTTIGVVGGIVLLVVLFLAYYCGGYVAGRMARFDGARQGVAVWLWAVVIAALMAALGAVAGEAYDVTANLDSFPRIPIDEGDLTSAGIIIATGIAVSSLAGAVLGGLAGMHYHRKVDRAGYPND